MANGFNSAFKGLRREHSFSLFPSPPRIIRYSFLRRISLVSIPRMFRYSFLLRISLFVFFLLFSYSLPHLCLRFVLFTVARSVVQSRFISLQFLPFNTACTCCVSAMFPICILVFQEACLDCIHASDLCGTLCHPWILRSEHVPVHLPCVWNMI
jgi:hypothetical protein